MRGGICDVGDAWEAATRSRRVAVGSGPRTGPGAPSRRRGGFARRSNADPLPQPFRLANKLRTFRISRMKCEDLTGQRFGKMTVVGRAPHASKNAYWTLRCDCGNELVRAGVELRRRTYKHSSCRPCMIGYGLATRHGHTGGGHQSITYMSWRAMRSRCECPENVGFESYGGRGISICERWVGSFQAFLDDMGERPPGHTLDRINPDGNYEPSNCRWATPAEQVWNRRVVTLVDGVPLNHYAVREGVGVNSLYLAVKQGLTPQEAVARIRATRERLRSPGSWRAAGGPE